MSNLRFPALALLVLGTVSSCDTGFFEPPGPASARGGSGSGLRVVAPVTVAAGARIPVVIRAETAYGGLDPSVDGAVRLSGGPDLDTVVVLKKGVGSALLPPAAAGRLSLSAASRGRSSRPVRIVANDTVIHVAGTIPQPAWTRGALWLVEADAVLPAGHTLTIEGGTRVALAPGANLVVRGTLLVDGSDEAPVTFRAADPLLPWGGIAVEGGTARIRGTFITGGGGDASRSYGHSGSQATVFGDGAEVSISDSWLMDNAGKGLGARGGRFSVRNTLVTRCDMGGEFNYASVTISGSHILDIPNGDGTFVDDDNDGLYFWAANPDSDPPSLVENTYLVTGKDDGIDHNDARLVIRDSWIEGFVHEGIAASSGHSVHVTNTVIRGNGQGIEAGYGSPDVTVDHSVIVDNGVGVRFGDEYAEPSAGRLRVSNSILAGNDVAVLDHDPPQGGTGPAEIVRSMTDAGVLPGCTDCLSASPEFAPGYFLLPGSPGSGGGTDGLDLGRYRVRPERRR